jgi:hypothetical protein
MLYLNLPMQIYEIANTFNQDRCVTVDVASPCYTNEYIKFVTNILSFNF